MIENFTIYLLWSLFRDIIPLAPENLEERPIDGRDFTRFYRHKYGFCYAEGVYEGYGKGYKLVQKWLKIGLFDEKKPEIPKALHDPRENCF